MTCVSTAPSLSALQRALLVTLALALLRLSPRLARRGS